MTSEEKRRMDIYREMDIETLKSELALALEEESRIKEKIDIIRGRTNTKNKKNTAKEKKKKKVIRD
eukprot:CAMPEP_0204859194 /NCGR_PEP_ID=MMETSP1347-20130617/23541_1 /ASSEMBLY_ACC=CAM_ASM_000690 /TAXON_ID=215587 /ORGANISM="Aplanochytrium stocchinoi, Strain GSBS06" /LENGTH=65 /DNA_ID=CAMNT_0052007599 /DNA_START=229 /DNA_END=426 /DNA_ORIENTATION=-